MAENITLRESVRDLTSKAQGLDSEYWRCGVCRGGMGPSCGVRMAGESRVHLLGWGDHAGIRSQAYVEWILCVECGVPDCWRIGGMQAVAGGEGAQPLPGAAPRRGGDLRDRGQDRPHEGACAQEVARAACRLVGHWYALKHETRVPSNRTVTSIAGRLLGRACVRGAVQRARGGRVYRRAAAAGQGRADQALWPRRPGPIYRKA